LRTWRSTIRSSIHYRNNQQRQTILAIEWTYLGLVPSEDSSGEKRRQGAITKTGSRHARRLLVEAAWHYRKAPARGQALKRRQDGQPAHVLAISWQAQQRLHRVWRRLDHDRGKRRTIVAVAVARELAGFCWALATAD
jgi:transposase